MLHLHSYYLVIQISIYLQLIANPSINICKDLEQFLAYDGGAEIEFVQEIVEFIPPSARIDKVITAALLYIYICMCRYIESIISEKCLMPPL